MKLKYVGPFDEVEIPSLGLTCKRLGTVEVVGDPAQNLREQGDWEWVKPAPKKATKRPPRARVVTGSPEAAAAHASVTEEKGEDVG